MWPAGRGIQADTCGHAGAHKDSAGSCMGECLQWQVLSLIWFQLRPWVIFPKVDFSFPLILYTLKPHTITNGGRHTHTHKRLSAISCYLSLYRQAKGCLENSGTSEISSKPHSKCHILKPKALSYTMRTVNPHCIELCPLHTPHWNENHWTETLALSTKTWKTTASRTMAIQCLM